MRILIVDDAAESRRLISPIYTKPVIVIFAKQRMPKSVIKFWVIAAKAKPRRLI